jgi:hypothetical protein
MLELIASRWLPPVFGFRLGTWAVLIAGHAVRRQIGPVVGRESGRSRVVVGLARMRSESRAFVQLAGLLDRRG